MKIPFTNLEVGQSYAELPQGPYERAEGVSRSTAASGSEVRHPFEELFAGGYDGNPELQGRLKYEVWDEMRMADPTVRSVLWLYKLPIRGADWRLDPASEDPVDRAVRDLFAEQFGIEEFEGRGWLDLTWDELNQQDLLCLDFGSMHEELVWGERRTWTDSDGDEHPVLPLARLMPLFPQTIFEMPIDSATGRPQSISQDLPGARPVPAAKLMHYVFEREGPVFWGNSLLRGMYMPWRIKKQVAVADMIAVDRASSGVPVVRYPSGGGVERKREAETIGRNWRTHERAYVVLEGAAPGPTWEGGGWDVEFPNASASVLDPTARLKYWDEQIAGGGLAWFTKLGTTGHGGRAVGGVLEATFYGALEAVANRTLAENRMRWLFRRYADINLGPDVAIPKLRVAGIEADDVLQLAQSISLFSNAGLRFDDPDTQDDIRDRLRLDKIPKELRDRLDAAIARGRVGVVPNTEPPPAGEPPPDEQPPEPPPSEGQGLGH